MPLELAPGFLVANRYRLDRLIGEGGMGAVWAATHLITHKTLALKFLKAPEQNRAELTRRFLREARAACAVEHPNIVQVHDVIELDDGMPVMVMEMLVGESLQQKLKREGSIDLAELAELILPVLSAVTTAHAAGIVHRDLKPDNIFLAEGPSGATSKVLDFGIAKVTFDGDAEGGVTGTGAMLGSPYYMSPEQVEGNKDLDYRSDIWSLGIIVYQCLSGSLPTAGATLGQILRRIMVGPTPSLSEVAPWLPAEILEVVERMLVRDRIERLSDLRTVRDVLARHAGGGLGESASADRAPGGPASSRGGSGAEAERGGVVHSALPEAHLAFAATRPVSNLPAKATLEVAQAEPSSSVAGQPAQTSPDSPRRSDRSVRGLALVGLATLAVAAWAVHRANTGSDATGSGAAPVASAFAPAPPATESVAPTASIAVAPASDAPDAASTVEPATSAGRAVAAPRQPASPVAAPVARPPASAAPATRVAPKRHEGIN